MEEREDEEKEQYFSCLCNRALNQSAHKDLFSLQGRKKVAAIDIEEHLLFYGCCSSSRPFVCVKVKWRRKRENENSFSSQFRTQANRNRCGLVARHQRWRSLPIDIFREATVAVFRRIQFAYCPLLLLLSRYSSPVLFAIGTKGTLILPGLASMSIVYFLTNNTPGSEAHPKERDKVLFLKDIAVAAERRKEVCKKLRNFIWREDSALRPGRVAPVGQTIRAVRRAANARHRQSLDSENWGTALGFEAHTRDVYSAKRHHR